MIMPFLVTASRRKARLRLNKVNRLEQQHKATSTKQQLEIISLQTQLVSSLDDQIKAQADIHSLRQQLTLMQQRESLYNNTIQDILN